MEGSDVSGTAFARLPQALRLLRKRRGWTQRELAAAVGFTVKQVSAYETGRQRPRIETLERILEQLQATARVLAQTMAAFDDRPAAELRPAPAPRTATPRRALKPPPSADPARAVRDGKPFPAAETAARPSSHETFRGLAKRLPALRLLADELALDVVTATVRRGTRQVAGARRRGDEASEESPPREAK